MKNPELILASASSIRLQLIENAGFSVRVVPAKIDERCLEDSSNSDGEARAGHLAAMKAETVSARHPDALVIGADQTLMHNGQQLHKPPDRTAAADQLWRLRGSTHTLHAAIALARAGKVRWSHLETANMTMRTFSRTELEEVLGLEGDNALSSVGAYRLEGPSVRLFARIEGDYFSILGLPLLPLIAVLREHGPDAYRA